ncbi:hypothetical protein G6M12_24975 [Agrobacterium tumefaciens]|jgi:hypothetical protein|nr:hypothetical protein [Agrobacterium tumefaciens]
MDYSKIILLAILVIALVPLFTGMVIEELKTARRTPDDKRKYHMRIADMVRSNREAAQRLKSQTLQ